MVRTVRVSQRHSGARPQNTSHDHAMCGVDRDLTIRRMPMIDVYSPTGTFSDKNRLAEDLAAP